MRAIRTMAIGGALCFSAIGVTEMRGDHRAPNHVVVIHIESFNDQTVDVHVKATPAGVQVMNRSGVPFPPDTVQKAEVAVATPADIRISAAVQTIEISTADNKSVKVQFTEGATDVEKRLKPWGRMLAFKRVEGNLQPSPKVLSVEPAH